MKTENLTAEEATEIIQRGGVVEDRAGDKWASFQCRYSESSSAFANYAPYRVITPPPDAEPVVTAEEFIANLPRLEKPNSYLWSQEMLQTQLSRYKAARKPKPKPKPQPIRTLAEALACVKLELHHPAANWTSRLERLPWGSWGPEDIERIEDYLDGYDKGRRVYDASKKE